MRSAVYRLRKEHGRTLIAEAARADGGRDRRVVASDPVGLHGEEIGARHASEEPVEIGADCWIGMGVCILPGARLGDGCVVGGGSVVAGELESNCIAVGNPARPKKSR